MSVVTEEGNESFQNNSFKTELNLLTQNSNKMKYEQDLDFNSCEDIKEIKNQNINNTNNTNDIFIIDEIEKNDTFFLINELDKAIQINFDNNENNNKENNNTNECEEILSILRQPLSNKNIRRGCPMFKKLKEPRKISLVGRRLTDLPSDSTKGSSNNSD